LILGEADCAREFSDSRRKLHVIAGAASGATIDYLFMTNFQDVATGHFLVRRLERKYGSDLIKNLYQSLAEEEAELEKGYSPVVGW